MQYVAFQVRTTRCRPGGVICSGALVRRMASKFVVALPAETMSATSLGAGEQRPMDDLRIDAYGVIDEANSAIGLARVATVTDPDCAKLDAMLLCVQNDLFDLGADLYMPELNANVDGPKQREISTSSQPTFPRWTPVQGLF